MAKKTAKTYHHGDLREALITAGRAIFEKDGAGALTLGPAPEKPGFPMLPRNIISPASATCSRKSQPRALKIL